MAFSFGTTSTTVTTPSFSFGSSITPATGTGGTTGLQFNAPATSQPSTGLSFGTPVTTSSFSFGGTSGGSLSFGTPTTTANTGLGFKPPTGGLSFGTSPQPSASLGTPGTLAFGTPAQTPNTTTNAPLSFGITPAAQPATSVSFGGFNAPKSSTTTTPATGLFSFSTPKTTATGFSLTTSGTGTGLFAAPTTQTTAAPPATPFKGLGGVDTAQSLSGSGNQSDSKSGKENLVPNEVMQTVDSFKSFVKQQKNLACEVSRASVKPIKKVMEDTESLRLLLSSISSVQQKNRTVTNKLKTDTSKCLVQCEMAQRTHDTPIGLQNDNIAPLEFFIELVSKFERDVQDLRQEIDNTEKHVKSLSQPAALSPQELSIALKRLHDSFVALAGRLQTVHSQVVAQKERHLSVRRHIVKDTSNIFEPSEKREIIPKRAMFQATASPGPTPFSSIGNNHSLNLLSFQENSISPFQAGNQLSGWGSNAASNLITGTQNNFLQSSSNPLSSPTLDNQNFQLLKPPLGNKRGKR